MLACAYMLIAMHDVYTISLRIYTNLLQPLPVSTASLAHLWQVRVVPHPAWPLLAVLLMLVVPHPPWPYSSPYSRLPRPGHGQPLVLTLRLSHRHSLGNSHWLFLYSTVFLGLHYIVIKWSNKVTSRLTLLSASLSICSSWASSPKFFQYSLSENSIQLLRVL